MLQVDQVELLILERTCISNLIIFNNNKFSKVLTNKMLLEELEIGNL